MPFRTAFRSQFLAVKVLLLACLALCAVPVVAAPKPPAGMVLVPAGKFIMGTNKKDRKGHNVPRTYDDARPRHSVTLPAFYIDKTEVTNKQYLQFCKATHYPLPPGWPKSTFPAGKGDYPVRRVSWYEARAYAHWAGKRLPTEAEWEKAARGTDGRAYPWGNDWDKSRLVWGRKGPDKVGQHPQGASPYGALDMAGNVFDWTSSWYAAYPDAPLSFPEYDKTLKVIRGGGYYGYRFQPRTYFRSVDKPTARSEWIGFRCARDAP